jgi:hypothetical protein
MRVLCIVFALLALTSCASPLLPAISLRFMGSAAYRGEIMGWLMGLEPVP